MCESPADMTLSQGEMSALEHAGRLPASAYKGCKEDSSVDLAFVRNADARQRPCTRHCPRA